MPTQVDDELEKYAAKPASGDDELEKYARKPEAEKPESGSLDEYLKSPPSYSSAGGGGSQKPGFVKRLGESLSLPTTKEEFSEAAKPPGIAESVLGPIVPAAKGAYEWGKRAVKNIGEGLTEEKEAAQNIIKGQPIIPNIGKAAYGIVHGGVGSIPFIGEPTETAGEDVLNKNYAGAAGGLTGVAAQVLAPELAERGRGAVAPKLKALGEKAALKLRQPDNTLKPGTEAGARAIGAGLGSLAHLAGIPTVGELGGCALGPKFAEALIPNYPERIPVKPGENFAPLPSAEEFYANRAEDRVTRGKEQGKLDEAHAKRLEEAETARQKELSDAEKLKEQHAEALMRRGKEQTGIDKAAAKEKEAAAPEVPKIISPGGESTVRPTEGEARRTGNEGRAATWTNERVLELAAKGNRDAIGQAVLRGMELPPNARYVMGDPDVSRAVLNPKEITRFTPEGEPIRNKENPFTQEPTAAIPTLKRTPRAIPALSPVTPNRAIPFPGPMPEAAPLPAAAAVGERPQATVPQASAAPTLLEPIAPMGIKPLQGVKPIMEGAPETQNVPRDTISKGGKVGPPAQRFTQEEILNAEGLLASEAGAMLSADRPGVYFDEVGQTDRPVIKENPKKGVRRGGTWRGVSSGRDMYPFMRDNPQVNPAEVEKALRNKDSAAYNKLVTRAVEFNRQQAAGVPEALPEAMDFIRSLRENPDAEPPPERAAAQPSQSAIPNIGETGVIPGMEQAVKEQNAGAAKVAGENLTAEANKPKDISAAAGRMETMSPLFRGTEASPQREIFGGAAPASQVPPAIEPVLKETGWEFGGKNSLGQYEIREPGTNVKLVLFERELQPDFIRRKIAEKEKQYGVPKKGPGKPKKGGDEEVPF